MTKPKKDGPCFVYGLIDPRTAKIFYVGMTYNPDGRFYAHHHDRGSFAYPRIKELGAAGLQSQLVILFKAADRLSARILERKLIAEYDALTNTVGRLDRREHYKRRDAESKAWLAERARNFPQFMGA